MSSHHDAIAHIHVLCTSCQVRLAAVRTLGKLGREVPGDVQLAATSGLVQLLADEQKAVRIAAVSALGKMPPEAVAAQCVATRAVEPAAAEE